MFRYNKASVLGRNQSPEGIKLTMSLGTRFIFGRRTTIDQVIEFKNVAHGMKNGYGGMHPDYKASLEMNMFSEKLRFDSHADCSDTIRYTTIYQHTKMSRATRSYMEAIEDLVMVNVDKGALVVDTYLSKILS